MQGFQQLANLALPCRTTPAYVHLQREKKNFLILMCRSFVIKYGG
jgi:hypothetical protein